MLRVLMNYMFITCLLWFTKNTVIDVNLQNDDQLKLLFNNRINDKWQLLWCGLQCTKLENNWSNIEQECMELKINDCNSIPLPGWWDKIIVPHEVFYNPIWLSQHFFTVLTTSQKEDWRWYKNLFFSSMRSANYCCSVSLLYPFIFLLHTV